MNEIFGFRNPDFGFISSSYQCNSSFLEFLTHSLKLIKTFPHKNKSGLFNAIYLPVPTLLQIGCFKNLFTPAIVDDEMIFYDISKKQWPKYIIVPVLVWRESIGNKKAFIALFWIDCDGVFSCTIRIISHL